LRERPDEVFKFLYPESLPLETVRVPGLVGFIERLLGVTTQQVSATSASDEQIQDDDRLELDDWHGLHFLFTGTAWEGQEPACFLLCGGDEIGEEDVGRARALRPVQVSQFASFLAELSHEELARRYNPTRMTALEISPKAIWTRPAAPGESGFDYLCAAFEELRDFVTATADRGDSLIVSVI
jgi:hypothetical protein